ncbi:hypothetical protein N7486_000705 [Penicillium sp. IBT 16267x]|nr:hypothetical protein N7486_000705 [Penicillium sp. IBT 16267x]
MSMSINRASTEKLLSGLKIRRSSACSFIDAGASVEARNRYDKTARQLAEERKNQKLTVALLPADERKKHSDPIITRIVNLINHIIFLVNMITAAISGALGVLKEYFGIGGSRDSSLPRDLQVCTTADDFKKNVNEYVSGTKLERFFPRDSQCIQKLAEGLVAFKDSKSPLNTPENLKGLIELNLYQTILYCDDSGSMDSPTTRNGSTKRIVAQRAIVERITRICSLLVPDDGGIHVRFTNSNVNWDRLNADQVRQNMSTINATGSTDIGTNLEAKVLKPFFYEHLEVGLKRPYLICISQMVNRILNLRIIVSFVICQIGDDSTSKAFIDTLSQTQLGDSIYVCTERIDNGFTEFNNNDEDLEIRV